jgi:hypothetical protein
MPNVRHKGVLWKNRDVRLILPLVKHTRTNLMPTSSGNLQHYFIQSCRAQDINMVTSRCSTSRIQTLRSMRQLFVRPYLRDRLQKRGGGPGLRTSTVTTLIPLGFHVFRFHPSTHIAPSEIRLTVPSPSPILTPFRTWLFNHSVYHILVEIWCRGRRTLGTVSSFETAVSIQLSRASGRSKGVRGMVALLNPPGD